MGGTITKGTDLQVASIELQFLAKKHFAEGSWEHEFLTELAASLGQTYLLHHYLMRVQKQIDRVHAVKVPDEQTVLHLSLQLTNVSDSLARWADADAAQSVKQASELLLVWYDLYLTLDLLMDASKELRFVGWRPAGSA